MTKPSARLGPDGDKPLGRPFTLKRLCVAGWFRHRVAECTVGQNKMVIARTFPELPDPWPFDQEPNVVAVTSSHITRDGLPVLLVTHYEDDDSWGFQSGQPVTMAEAQLVAMKTVFGFDPTIVEIADLEPGWSAVRESVGSQWVRYKDDPEDEEV